MFYNLIQFIITLIFLFIASITDLKERIVKNSLTFSLIVLGLIFNLALSIYFNDLQFIFNSIISGVLCFIFSFILLKLGVWAAGDLKLFTGIALMNPLNPKALSFLFQVKSIELPIFFFSLFIVSVLVTLPFTLFLSFFLLYKKKDQSIIIKFKELIYGIALFSFFITSIKSLLSFLPIQILSIALIFFSFIFMFLKEKEAVIVLFALALFLNSKSILIDFSMAFGLLAVLSSLFFFFTQTKTLLSEEKDVKELNEGDILAETIVEINNKIEKREPLSLMKTIKNLKELKINVLAEKNERIIASPLNARGLNKEELSELKALREKGIILKVKVKKSIPMIPLVLIAYILLNVIGDSLWFLI